MSFTEATSDRTTLILGSFKNLSLWDEGSSILKKTDAHALASLGWKREGDWLGEEKAFLPLDKEGITLGFHNVEVSEESRALVAAAPIARRERSYERRVERASLCLGHRSRHKRWQYSRGAFYVCSISFNFKEVLLKVIAPP